MEKGSVDEDFGLRQRRVTTSPPPDADLFPRYADLSSASRALPVREQEREPFYKVSAWKLLQTAIVVGLGAPKAWASYEGEPVTATTFDLVCGTIFVTLQIWLSPFEDAAIPPEALSWLFADLRPPTLKAWQTLASQVRRALEHAVARPVLPILERYPAIGIVVFVILFLIGGLVAFALVFGAVLGSLFLLCFLWVLVIRCIDFTNTPLAIVLLLVSFVLLLAVYLLTWYAGLSLFAHYSERRRRDSLHS